MNISNQNQQSFTDILGAFSKTPTKEGVVDAFMKLVETPTNEGKTVFSLEEAMVALHTEKKEQPLFAFLQGAEIPPENVPEMAVEKTSLLTAEVESEVKEELLIERFTEPLKEDLLEIKQKNNVQINAPLEQIKNMDALSIVQMTIPSSSLSLLAEKNENDSFVEGTSAHLPKQTAKTYTEMKQEQQILILKDLAKQLSPASSLKQEVFSMTNPEKAKMTWIQLPLNDDLADRLAIEEYAMPEEMGKSVAIETTPTDGWTLESKMDPSFRNDALKTGGIPTIKHVITQEMEQYIEFKEVNAKKISLTVQHEEWGNVGIQIEKKEDKIHILLRVELFADKEKMEQTMEQLKQELKEKNIDVDYEVEQEDQQKEKRKEQEQMTEKENKREKSGEEENNVLKFDELLEVGL